MIDPPTAGEVPPITESIPPLREQSLPEADLPPLREHVGTHADKSLPETQKPPLPGSVPPLPHLTGEKRKAQKIGGKTSVERIAQLVTGIVLSSYGTVMFYNILQNPTIGANAQGVGIMLMAGISGLVGVKAIIKSFKEKENSG